MTQYDIREWRGGGTIPFVVDIQSDFLKHLTTRVVIPLRPASATPVLPDRLNPQIDLAGRTYYLSTAELVGTRRENLGPVVGSVADQSFEITNAVDMILSGL